MKGRIYRVIFVLMFFSSSYVGLSQTSSFLSGGVDEFIRNNQVIGKTGPQNSCTIRSFSYDLTAVDSLLNWSGLSVMKKGSISSMKYLPLNMELVYNSHHPYGWNEGSMIPASGISVKFSGGIRVDYGHLSVQLQPELVVSQNSSFETFFTQQYDTTWTRYYQWLNKSDNPERFGNQSYKKIFGGQSSIRYNFDALSVGISTENMWWGPGTRNALVMSNNAPGFLHFSFNTTKPVQTKLGSFEWQLIGGTLSNSGILPIENNRVYTNGAGYLYKPKNEATRYLAGMVVSWQPKWVKGLFLGFAKASYLYGADLGIADILPLEGIIKSTAEKNGKKASLGSLFARYVMPEEKAELYIEYGRNDKSPNLINLLSETAYPRAYVAGFRKLFTAKHGSFIEFSSEVTQMGLPAVPDLIHGAKSWYLDDYVRQGYTNMGKVMGAGIGPGSNSQMLGIAWMKGIKKVGIQFERIVRNNDFYYNAFEESKDYRRHWVDLSTNVYANWTVNRFLFSAQVSLIRSLNYEWWYFDYLPQVSPTNYFKNGYDVLNFHAGLNFSYRL